MPIGRRMKCSAGYGICSSPSLYSLCHLCDACAEQSTLKNIQYIHRACCVGDCPSELDQPVRVENRSNRLLDLLKAHVGAAFAFQVVKEASQRHKLLLTVAVRTVVDLLLVLRGVQVLFERGAGTELLVAECTFPPAVVGLSGVQSSIGGPSGAVRNLLVGDVAFGVALADDAMDGLAIEGTSVGTGAGF
jgi:hypothetical protein